MNFFVVLAVALALAVGLSLAALHAPILYPAAVIGLVVFIVTASGTKVGPALGRLIGKRAELAGGLVLILIAVKILADHLQKIGGAVRIALVRSRVLLH